jgi:DNA-binding NarL/FixJ family response regulator
VTGVEGRDAAGTPVRIMIVEDHRLVREAVAETLERNGMEVVSQVASAEDALAVVAVARPDIVLVDIDLPGMTGIALVRELMPRLPRGIIIMLTASTDSDHLLAAVRAGAMGYLTKDLSPEALARAVRGAMDGDLPMPRRLAATVVRELAASERRRRGPASDRLGLSVREQEVLALVSTGHTDRAIGERLGISARTVGHHVGNILAKLEVSNREAAAHIWRAVRSDENGGEEAASRLEYRYPVYAPTADDEG